VILFYAVRYIFEFEPAGKNPESPFFEKKGLENRSSRFEPKNSWISFSRGSRPPLNTINIWSTVTIYLFLVKSNKFNIRFPFKNDLIIEIWPSSSCKPRRPHPLLFAVWFEILGFGLFTTHQKSVSKVRDREALSHHQSHHPKKQVRKCSSSQLSILMLLTPLAEVTP